MANKFYTKVKDRNQNYDKNNSLKIENYIQDEIDSQIDEYNTINSLEDLYTTLIIDVDDFNFELACELKKRLSQLNSGEQYSDRGESTAKAQKYEYWIKILKQIDGFITSRELDVLNKCISGYATECYPYERRKEIKRNIFYLLNGRSEINRVDLLELDYKINHIDVLILFELTEILLELENLYYCSTIPENSHDFSKMKNKLSFSAFLYHWEESDIDYIQEYEIHTELCWINSGLIQDYWEADYAVAFYFANGSYQPEYDYFINQANVNDQHNIDRIDLGDYECLCEDDLFKDTWLVAGKEFPNLIDYFYEAEVMDLFQDASTVCRDDLSEQEYWNYSKYLCYQDDSCFYYCNKESCEGCTHSCTEKVVNQQYLLWQKYVQPIELV